MNVWGRGRAVAGYAVGLGAALAVAVSGCAPAPLDTAPTSSTSRSGATPAHTGPTRSSSTTSGSSSRSTSSSTSTTSRPSTGNSPSTSPSSSSATSTSSTPSSTTTTSPSPSGSPPLTETSTLRAGDSGEAVRKVQERLSGLGYWLGKPDGVYGELTAQAVIALQKVAGIARDGVYGPDTRRALDQGVLPKVRSSGNAVEIDLSAQVLTIVRNGRIVVILNTSTGSGQEYESRGATHVAVTPAGTFHVFRVVDGWDDGPLGALWRPRYFNGGIAVHGYSSVPAQAASHGCARVSIPAMNMIWARDLMPVGMTVLVF